MDFEPEFRIRRVGPYAALYNPSPSHPLVFRPPHLLLPVCFLPSISRRLHTTYSAAVKGKARYGANRPNKCIPGGRPRLGAGARVKPSECFDAARASADKSSEKSREKKIKSFPCGTCRCSSDVSYLFAWFVLSNCTLTFILINPIWISKKIFFSLILFSFANVSILYVQSIYIFSAGLLNCTLSWSIWSEFCSISEIFFHYFPLRMCPFCTCKVFTFYQQM